MCYATGVAIPSVDHGQGTVRAPQTSGCFLRSFWFHPLDPRGPWALSTLSTHLLRPWEQTHFAHVEICPLGSKHIPSKTLGGPWIRNSEGAPNQWFFWVNFGWVHLGPAEPLDIVHPLATPLGTRNLSSSRVKHSQPVKTVRHVWKCHFRSGLAR